MRALVIADQQVHVEERPDPEPGPGEVLVRVHGAGLNRADLVQRAGFYQAPPGSPADIPGLEFAGEVVAHGDGVSEPALGARVFGIAGGGGQAQLIAVPASQCAPVPDALDLVTAGSVPEVFVTAHDALFTQCELRAGEVLLVHAVGSGVGTAAVQLGHAAGCTVVGTARTAEKLEQARPLGLDHGILAAREFDPAHLAVDITDAVGNVDVVLELVGGDYVVTDLAVTGLRGRIALVGMMAGTRTQVDLGALLMKRIRVFGTTLRGRPVEEKSAATAAFARDVVPMLADGRVVPVVARTLPLDEGPAAYDLLASDTTFGGIVLDCT
jgi:NADPH:quinone reductase